MTGIDAFPTALGVAAQIRAHELSASEALEIFLERVDRLNPGLNAVVWRDDDAARAEAKNIDRRLAERSAGGSADTPRTPPFAGVPIPVKDLTRAAGQPVTFGSAGAPGSVAEQDEPVIAALRRAGFVLCGRTNLPEFGQLPVTENERYGVTRNPWDPSRTSGGSSGGAGTAVAAGMVPVAHGNDGGGSIRIPASCCGLVGLKASRGRVPSTALAWFGLTIEGVLCHDVADAATILDEISRPDPTVWEQAPPPARPFAAEVGADPGTLRVALSTTSALGIEPEESCRVAVERAGTLLEELGHHVSLLEEDVLDPALAGPFLNVVNASYGVFADIDWDKVEPHNAAGHRAGMELDAVTLAASLQQLRNGARDVAARWGRDFDVLVTPTMAIEPPVAGEVLAATDAEPGLPPLQVLAMIAYTVAANLTGQPAISLPLHTAQSGLPVGVQVVGGPWDESGLIRLASQLEAAAPWRERHPALG